MDILGDIEKKAEKVVEILAKEVATELHEKYYDVLDNFYADYSPIMYVRTNQAKYMALLPEIAEAAGLSASGGIKIDPSRIGFYQSIFNWNASADWVFNRIWSSGIHGWSPWEFPDSWMGYVRQPDAPSSPTPEVEMDEFFTEMCNSLDGRADRVINSVF